MGPHPRRPASLQPPRQAGDNAFIERFNGRLRDECLNTNWFYGLEQAREVIAKVSAMSELATDVFGASPVFGGSLASGGPTVEDDLAGKPDGEQDQEGGHRREVEAAG